MQAEEKQLMWYCMERTRMGIGLTSAELAQEVEKILQIEHCQTPKGGFKPTDGWLQQFKQWNPEATVRKPSKMSNPSANIEEKDVCNWFAEAKEEIMKIKGGEAALKDPR